MYTQVEKKKVNNRTIAKSIVHNKSNVKQGYGFMNNKNLNCETTICKNSNNLVVQRCGGETTGDLTTSPDHIKGNPKGMTRSRHGKPGKLRTQSSKAVIKRAQELVTSGKAKLIDTTDNDFVYEVPRKNPESKKAPRRFHKHRGGGDGKTFGFFEVPNDVRGADEKGEFSDSDSE